MSQQTVTRSKSPIPARSHAGYTRPHLVDVAEQSPRKTRELLPAPALPLPPPRMPRRFLLFVTLGMVLFFVGFISWNLWFIPLQENMNYGTARISKYSANVGHGGISYFISLDVDGKIEVVELFDNNTSTPHYYVGPSIINDSSSSPRLVTVSAVTNPTTNLIDLAVHVEGTSGSIMLYNNGASFQWTPYIPAKR